LGWSEEWFEALARTLASPRSRRGVLGSIAAGSVAALIPAVAQAADGPASQGRCKHSGKTACCVNTASDAGNCGACGNACPPGRICTNGHCDCPSGLDQCPSGCISTASDNLNCGSCGHVCPAGTVCVGGRCQLVCNPCCNVTCKPLDQCHVAGTCDPATGLCSNPAAPPGTACDTGNKCLLSGTCQSGVCVGTPVTCTARDQCHTACTCDPTTGLCSNLLAPNGTPCTNGTCVNGTCTACGVVGGPCCDRIFCQSGCCASGTCVAGTSNTACGASGFCVDCTASSLGHRCINGRCGCATLGDCRTGFACDLTTATCTTLCGTDTTACNGGCCSSGTCVAGTSDSACGTSGVCADCTVNRLHCVNGT
jgi:hypothetical protein